MSTIYRSAYTLRHGMPSTLDEMMRQEGMVARFAESQPPDWSPAERAAIRAVLAPHRRATATPIVFACLYGDAAAREVGYPALGLPRDAGLELAAIEAQTAAVPLAL